jgi:DNA polymerase III alpha subunit
MSENMQTLKDLVEQRFKDTEFKDNSKYRKRLNYELIEVETQNCADYFLEIYQSNKKYKNENNLLIPHLLGICDDFSIDQMPKIKTNEFPDVDIDFLATVRDYLKNEFAPKHYKPENTCSIGTYGRYALKSSLLDMARIYGLDRQEALNITTSLRLRDEDGEVMTYEESLESFPELKTYLEKYPQVAIAIQKLMNRIRSTGKHAGGVIVCNDAVNKFVPLMKTTGGDSLVSQYVEGLATQELGPIGLVKFDLLVVSALEQLGVAARLIKDRHDIAVIAGKEEDWDETDYLNDSKCIETADNADLLGVFQYDSDGIREVVKKAGINSFDDLVAIVSLYRPGPLNMKMDELFIKRKRGVELYENHPLLEPILGNTYGILIYQEQVMKMLNVVGKIPLKDCETIRKAISKKKISSFIKYKEMFIENGINVLETTREEVTELWKNLEFFSSYGFNLSHATAYTFTSSRQLYLKTYFPIEFYTALLMLETDEEKIRIYISDAERHGIHVSSLDLNKSKDNFSIQDGKIYIGFGNIKGIGEDRAKDIVKLQPFTGFEDFITRFGTDATVLRALIPLRIFNDEAPDVLYKFWQYYTTFAKKDNDRDKRYAKTVETIKKQMVECLPSKYSKMDLNNQDVYDSFIIAMKDNEHVQKLHKKYVKCKNTFESKTIEMPYLDGFDPDLFSIDDKELKLELENLIISENKYYGFQFTNRIKTCRDYNPSFTFTKFLESFSRDKSIRAVQIDLLDVIDRTSKSGGKYCQLLAMDSDFKIARINVWEEDNKLFSHYFKKGNLLSIHLLPPTNGFSTYSLLAPPKHKRYLLIKNAELDVRVVKLN